jgi:Zinc finger, C3HC4 type (RING finger)
MPRASSPPLVGSPTPPASPSATCNSNSPPNARRTNSPRPMRPRNGSPPSGPVSAASVGTVRRRATVATAEWRSVKLVRVVGASIWCPRPLCTMPTTTRRPSRCGSASPVTGSAMPFVWHCYRAGRRMPIDSMIWCVSRVGTPIWVSACCALLGCDSHRRRLFREMSICERVLRTFIEKRCKYNGISRKMPVFLRNTETDAPRYSIRFPVHCAVMGGSLELVRWLVDTQLCPLFAAHHTAKGHAQSIPTSSGRTVLDLVMSGRRPKPDILHYLVVAKGVSINDIKDTTLALQTLESLLKRGICLPPSNTQESPFPSSNTEPTLIFDDPAADEATDALQDPCALCCDRETDCVLLPCGHQMCCTECGAQLAACPACKVPCTVLRIFRQ